MRNIPGNIFINNSMKNTKYFKRGVPYIIKNIKKVDNGLQYIFIDRISKEEKEIVFESAKQADSFLDQYKTNS